MAGAFSSGFSSSYSTTAGGAPWTPGDPWPGTTPGGAARPEWGGYIRFWLLVEIAAGFPFTAGPDANDRLNAGNVLGDAAARFGAPAGVDPAAFPSTSGLWVDVTCDVVDCEIKAGAGTAAGILSKAEAGTLTATLYDPTGKYDPLNPDTPYALAGRSRLVPGQRCIAFCEIVDNPVTAHVTQRMMFTGTVDRWSEQWAKEPSDRQAKLVATDFTKQLVKLDRDEQSPQGDGDMLTDRLFRIADYFGFGHPYGNSLGAPVVITYQPTTLAQSAWELLNRTIDDELGYLWVAADGTVVYTYREAWTWRPAPAWILKVGCGDPAVFYDIVTDAAPAAIDATQINTVSAANSGGTTQHAANTASVNRWGERSYQRTDLGLRDNGQAARWAQDLVNLAAYPRYTIEKVTLVPAVGRNQPACWNDVLRTVLDYTAAGRGGFVAGIVNVVYESDRFDYTVDTSVRMVGYTFRLTADRWEIELATVDANLGSGAHTFHVGAHAQDRLDAGNVAA